MRACVCVRAHTKLLVGRGEGGGKRESGRGGREGREGRRVREGKSEREGGGRGRERVGEGGDNIK